MRISEETMENFSVSYPLERLAPVERILFIDIETTGFAARSSYLYLIGCAYFLAGKWHTIQWMAENFSQEKDILSAFLEFAKLYRYMICTGGSIPINSSCGFPTANRKRWSSFWASTARTCFPAANSLASTGIM